jgi:hypothetical protein
MLSRQSLEQRTPAGTIRSMSVWTTQGWRLAILACGRGRFDPLIRCKGELTMEKRFGVISADGHCRLMHLPFDLRTKRLPRSHGRKRART